MSGDDSVGAPAYVVDTGQVGHAVTGRQGTDGPESSDDSFRANPLRIVSGRSDQDGGTIDCLAVNLMQPGSHGLGQGFQVGQKRDDLLLKGLDTASQGPKCPLLLRRKLVSGHVPSLLVGRLYSRISGTAL